MPALDIANPGDVLTAIDRGRAEWLPSAAAPLDADVTLYVDSATGDDANDGSQAAPFATLPRALVERGNYGKFSTGVTFAIQLIGVGPYSMERLSGSECEPGGLFVIRGDHTAKQIDATGTFTGNMSGNTVGTSAGLGTDVHAGRFIRVTSGALAGVVAQIAAHTDTSITVMQAVSWQSGAGTANGDTFEIFSPTTAVAGTGGQYASELAFTECVGASSGWDGGQPYLPAHVLYHVLLTGDLIALRSQVGLAIVESAGGWPTVSDRASLGCGGYASLRAIGGAHEPEDTGTYPGSGAGLSMISSGWLNINGDANVVGLLGVGSSNGVAVGDAGDVGRLTLRGSRIDSSLWVSGGALTQGTGARNYSVWQKGVLVRYDAALVLKHNTVVSAAAGSAITVQDAARVVQSTGSLTGAAAAVGSYGIDVQGNGEVVLRGAPAVTGGTAGEDLRVQGGTPQPNSTLNAAGTGLKSTVSNAAIFRAS